MVYKQTFKKDLVEEVPPPQKNHPFLPKHPPLVESSQSVEPVELDFPPSSSLEEPPDPG
jgi:hypothetical protein